MEQIRTARKWGAAGHDVGLSTSGGGGCLLPGSSSTTSQQCSDQTRAGCSSAPTMTFSKPAALLARNTALELWLPQPPLESLSLLNLPWLSSR